jgi:hypothetical protein
MKHDWRAQWRVPPRRYGPLDDSADWGEIIECNAMTLIVAIAIVTLLLAAYCWSADLFAGHL